MKKTKELILPFFLVLILFVQNLYIFTFTFNNNMFMGIWSFVCALMNLYIGIKLISFIDFNQYLKEKVGAITQRNKTFCDMEG